MEGEKMKTSALLVFSILGIGVCTACGGGASGGTKGGGGGGTQSVATHFSVTAAATATAGSPFGFMVRALDAANNVVTTYSGTAGFNSTDGQAVLPHSSTLTSGSGSFSATLNTTSNQTITATDVMSPSITGTSNLINVNRNKSSLAITSGQPPNGIVGQPYG